MRSVHLLIVLLMVLASISFDHGGADKGDDPYPLMEQFATIDHSPISLSGNTALQNLATTEKWSGSGISTDPFVISDYRIMATGSSCISISNTDLYLEIRGCNLTGASIAGILLSNSMNIRITGNEIGPNEGDGIRLIDSTRDLMDNNTMDATGIFVMNHHGIHLMGSSADNTIEKNRVHRSESDGIRIEDTSSHNLVADNNVVENWNNGIYIGADDNIVINNTLWANKIGVMVDGDNALISGNRMLQNSWGVNLHTGDGSKVNDNNMVRNNYGVRIYLSNNNEIFNNYILKSDKFGINIDHSTSSGNRIYGNILFYNNGTGSYYVFTTRQARDISKNNIWHSVTKRGNYWHDLRSPDSNGDGIVEGWYFLEGGEQYDLYPLVDSPIPDVFTPPKKLTAQPGKDHINLTWWPVNYGMGVRVQKFNIYKNEREGGEFYLDSTDADSLSYTDYDVLPGRSYYYYVTAVTEIAESNRSNRVKSSPDVVRPSISITSPEDNAVFNDGDVFVDWIGTDNIVIDYFEITLDDDPTMNVELNDHYLFLDLEEGQHSVEVRVYDMAEHNRSDTVFFHIDLTRPSIEIDKEGIGPLLFNTDLPLISWDSEDTGPGIDHHMVRYDGGNWTRLGDVKEYLFTSPLDAGLHEITVRCVDKGGNWAEDSVDIIIDLKAPTLWIVQPSGPGYYPTGVIEMVYSAFDDLTNVTGYFVRIDLENWISKGLEKSHNFTYLSEGEHHLYVKAVDGSGNELVVSTTGTVDMTPPEMSVMNLLDGVMYNGPVTLEWEAHDDISGMGQSRIRMDGGDWTYYPVPKPVIIEWFEDGSHYLVLEVFDKAGNVANINISFSFDVTYPFITFASPGGLDVAVGSNITIAFSEEMDRDSVMVDSPGIEGEFVWDGNNLTMIPQSDLEHSKRYSIAVSGKDMAGNDMVKFDWFFTTEEDLSLRYGRVHGRVVTTDGLPIPQASYRFKTGEKGKCDDDGRFDIFVTAGVNFIIVSNTSFHDTKVEFEVYEGEVENLGDIPVRSEKEYREEIEKRSDLTWLIVGLTIFVIIILSVLAGVAYQIKKTREYRNMGPVVDEWVSDTSGADQKPGTIETPPPALEESIK
ncbi:MAG: right-handed parallel beta-helix repeat-containing protein [Candidatus Thermoplasmatota archaeon]|nr:right-handed parallel beta-helix repeat-containing protein [Candidatus Thermoplasmatota archaeon]